MSNSRAVYTNLREQGILEQRQEEQHMGVLARACMSVAVTEGASSYFCMSLCFLKGLCRTYFHAW